MNRRDLLAILVGGVAGASVRWAILEHVAGSPDFPYAVLSIDVVGSVLLGVVVTRAWLDPSLGLLAGTGFCGSLTTFSTFAVDVAEFLRASRYGFAAGLVAASLVGGVGGALLGMRLRR